MKGKLYLFLICYFSLSVVTRGQSLFNNIDSLQSYLTDGNLFDPSKETQVAEILKFYLPKDEVKRDKSQLIFEYFEENDYLESYIPEEYTNKIEAEGFRSTAIDDVTMDATSTTSPFISSLAYGISDFLVTRTKEELKMAFFEKLLGKINQEATTKLFPQTISTLQTVGDEIYQYRIYLPTLQNSFKSDLETLHETLPNYVENIDNEKMKKESKDLLKDFLLVGKDIINKEEVHTIINKIGKESINAIANGEINRSSPKILDIRNGLGVLKILSNSLVKNKDTTVYVTLSDLDQVIRNPVLTDFYLGLVWQQLHNHNLEITGIGRLDKQLLKLVPPNSTDIEKQNFLATLRTVIQEGESLDKIIANLKSGELEGNAVEKSTEYYKMVSSLFTITRNLVKFLKIDKEDILKSLDVLEASAKIPINIKRKNYSLAIINTNTLLQYGLENENDKFSKQFMKYGTFIASIAASDNPGEINAIIEAYALPAGSYREKRKSNSTNIALNGYVGLFLASEKITNKTFQNATDEDIKLTAGLTAPIGVSFSWSGKKKNSAFTLFPHIIDLGALVSFRFSDPNTEDLPAFKWQNIIAPGIQASLGIPKTPLSISGGWQYGPYLRNITTVETDPNSMLDNSFNLEMVKASRWHLSLLVDIPIITLRKG